MMLQYLKKNETPPPKWMMVSGFFDELHLDAAERRRRVRIIYTSAVLIIRRELKRHEVDEFRSERSVFWDPVSEVCQSMEISQSKLSRFCKELTGNSLIQVIDSVRAEGLKRKLRDGIRTFLKDGFSGSQVVRLSGLAKTETSSAHGACLGTEKVDKWAVWEALKAGRKWPEFSQNTWAQEMGFSSYRRLYRACQVVYRMTPHQLEMALIEECLGEGVRGQETGDRGQETGVRGQESGVKVGSGVEFEEVTLEEAERLVREIRPDEWMRGMGG